MKRMRTRAVVRGVVQAVGFRYYAQAEADRLGVAGFVRNRRDGAVEVEAEGGPAAVSAMLAWLAHGPPSAVVESVETAELEPLGETGFRIDF
ncbi:acylphosphatase [Cryobacterium sp. MP_M5]|uniref:acylphosphatase n=1 Tax=unclassified Cryobacterium TaxID=2649013 RepID=UPI001A201A5E|nr:MULTISPECIES: acylphosphatase [unclassified Cryobacterium]MBG6058901.1 acylphosphatase [Cryobacterium sp. MP_M3]MEC5177090.1 acylphosphatase [Cryobacterium sp. MP_M5]